MSAPIPPPPPPPDPPRGNLAPPPRYAGYQPTPIGAVALKRVSGTAKALVIMLAIYVGLAVLVIIITRAAQDAARDFRRGDLSEDEFTEELAPFFGISVVQLGVTIAIVVLTMIWMYRMAANHRTIGRQTTWGAGFAIAGWFLPPFLFVIPFLMLMEMWKASDPSSPPQDESWRRSPIHPIIPIWWVLYGLVPIVLFFVGQNPLEGLGGDTDDIAERLDEQQATMLVQSLTSIAAAIAFAFLVRLLTERHTRLTGEATAR
jgi:hypothetical protein